MSKELILGSSGFVGSAFFNSRRDSLHPRSNELDITEKKSIEDYLKDKDIEIIINFAAFTNVKETNSQKGDLNGLAWQINVIGAKNLEDISHNRGIFLVQISTDNVFFGSKGPFSEDDRRTNSGEVDWYGYTKAKGEEEVENSGCKFAIVRIAYPFGNPDPKKDYILKLIQTIQAGYPLFSDQRFTPTYIPTLVDVLSLIVQKQIPGKFHVTCQGLTAPYEIGVFVKDLLALPDEVKKGSLSEYENKFGKPPYNPFGGLKTDETQKILGVSFPSWQGAIKMYQGELKRTL